MNQQDKIIAGLILFSFSITLITAFKFKHDSIVLKLKGNKKNIISLTKKEKEELLRNEAIQKKHPHLHVTEYLNDDYSHILGYNDENHVLSRLQSISKLRIEEVKRNKIPLDVNGCGIDRSFYISEDDLLSDISDFDESHGKPLKVVDKIHSTFPQMAIAAEFKRASPSKGDINPNLDVVAQCLLYAEMGAVIISVLTEFVHFKGTLADMKKVRLSTQKQFGSSRPAVLRKDFIFDRYQVLEARANGADTVLLIVAVLGVNQLRDLISFCRRMGMEPLVEVHTNREMEIALDCGAVLIGVNNRNLHNFQLDLHTTERILTVAESRGKNWRFGEKQNDICIAALSGITSSEDVNLFRQLGISCCLIGETLMKSPDPRQTIRELLSTGVDTDVSAVTGPGNQSRVLVKTCGMKSVGDVEAALQAGASFIGVIFASNSPRAASVEEAIEIVKTVRRYGERDASIDLRDLLLEQSDSKDWFKRSAALLSKVTLRKPLVVGVFQDQSIEEVNRIVKLVGLDLVQLHGSETPFFASKIIVPVVKVIHMNVKSDQGQADAADVINQIESFTGKAALILFDSKVPGSKGGGTGQTFDWNIVNHLKDIPVLLAGGLTVDNVKEAVSQSSNVIGVDVSSGLEIQGMPGVKDVSKMKLFIENSKI